MPTTPTYAKACGNFNAIIDNQTGLLNFSYDLYYDFNPGDNTWTGYEQISYFITPSLISMKLVIDANTGLTNLFELNWGNNQASFASQEYWDKTGDVTLDPGAVYGLINGALA